MRSPLLYKLLPLAAGLVCLGALVWVFSAREPRPEAPRLPVARPPVTKPRPVKAGQGEALIPGPGKPSALPGSWPQFRGANRDNLATSQRPLARAWPAGGPKVLWRVAAGEGHAGAAIHAGRVYLLDYDRDKQQDAIRCLSLDDGAELWRYVYPVEIKRNHGMSRTIPAVTNKYVVTLGPKCHVCCLDAQTGKLVWKKDLVAECGTIVPPWYAGQCPLIDGDTVILAPGARPLMMALDLATGQPRWQTPEQPELGAMTHSSVIPFTFAGKKQYVYCAQKGVIGVDAASGQALWTYPGWKVNIANVPTPVGVGADRLFFTGGYNAGSAMVRLAGEGGKIDVKELFRLKPALFGSDQQTPILYQDRLYGVIPSGELVCLGLDGKRLWDSGGGCRFGLGPFLIANDLIYALDDETGTLRLAEATPAGYHELAQAKVLTGHDAWGPMALAEGRLILRDYSELVCLDIGQ